MSIQVEIFSVLDSILPPSFYEVIENVYPDNSLLTSKKSELVNFQYAESVVIVNQDKKPVGRCIIYKNPFHLIDEKPVLSIGYLEAINNDEIWNLLIQEAQKIAIQLNINSIIGPMNGSTWEHYRLTDENDKLPFLSEPFYPSYYAKKMVQYGFEPMNHYVSNIDRIMDCKKERILKKEEELREILTIRPINTAELKEELESIYPLVIEAFSENHLYSPIDKETFSSKYEKLKSIIQDDLVLIAEDKETGEKAGFIFAFPDLLNTSEKGFIIKTLARNKKNKYAGIGSVLSNIATKTAKEKGYVYCIHAFMISTNSSMAISKSFTGENFKTHTLYKKDCQ